jgi:hypothetical protein
MEVEDLGIERMEVEGLDVSRILSPPTLDDQDDIRMGDHPDNADSEGSDYRDDDVLSSTSNDSEEELDTSDIPDADTDSAYSDTFP